MKDETLQDLCKERTIFLAPPKNEEFCSLRFLQPFDLDVLAVVILAITNHIRVLAFN